MLSSTEALLPPLLHQTCFYRCSWAKLARKELCRSLCVAMADIVLSLCRAVVQGMQEAFDLMRRELESRIDSLRCGPASLCAGLAVAAAMPSCQQTSLGSTCAHLPLSKLPQPRG